MGAKTWMLVHADVSAREALARGSSLDRDAAAALAARLFPAETLTPMEDGELLFTSPPDDELCIGCFQGVSVVAAKEFGIDHPSRLPRHFIDEFGRGTATLHAMHSVVDWFAYAVWKDGQLIRSLSLSPDNGVLEDIGERLGFEAEYWSGEHPAVEAPDTGDQPYPFPFHPLELGEAALLELFGYQLEGACDAMLFEPETIPLTRFKRTRASTRSRWKFW